ncbi:ABC transporter ATP-binding protein [Candidatus Halobonum tyrrellensis]|uniref:Molybdate/tungstate import ATP-binding protein WtpC n=1 Tax=Candidatus Halobonum tyrrellensis G22 TaxID=1324957 RepID=V4HGJ3_9EURY|nr:ABC transporter ATP-binding protein [Candidatus Halobonum tyrrellensis]ESP89233.1 polyamine-transporting ATPase [Candidatus Halobonum tyrrellensis G22]
MSLLRVRSLTKEFGDLTAVDDAGFDVEDGEFVSILGPSGSGKSTVLRMVAGFEQPTDGEIRLAGDDVVGSPPFERDVNMVFQDLALFPHLTVADNIGYGLKQRGVPADERRERTERMLEMVRLEGYGDRNPAELSGGEQQRVALARALVNEPALVLFDEPLSSLDRKLRQHMQGELQRIQAETNTTFLYVTHDQEVALAVSDRLIVLDDGRIQQVGPVEQLYEAPANKFVADFIGDVNAVEARVEAVETDRVVVDAGSGPVGVPRERSPDVAAGDAVDVCVRPYLVRVTAEPPAGDTEADAAVAAGTDTDADAGTDTDADRVAGTFSSPGTVRSRSYQGSDSLYAVETERWGPVSAEVRTGSFDVDDAVTVAWDGADVHLYERDAATGTGAAGAESGSGPEAETGPGAGG